MRKLKNVLSAIIILSGSFLEVLYVFYRYQSDGIPLPICIVIGLSLNVFLMLSVYKKKHALSVLLILFSVLNTTSGQTLSMLKKDNTAITQDTTEVDEQVKRYKADIAQLDKEIGAIDKRLSGFETMEAKAEYKNNVREDEKALTEKRESKTRLEEKIDTILNTKKETAIDTVQKTSVYAFYGSMNKWSGKDWITFILHTVLSIFISLMAPFGISTLEETLTKKQIDETPEAERDNSINVDDFIRMLYYGKEVGKPYIPKDDIMAKYCQIAGKDWNEKSKQVYQENLDKLTKDGFFTANNMIIKSKHYAIELLKGKESAQI